MAKQTEGYLGGFRGRLGGVVGYQWNGKWVVRACPRQVRNPRTEAQQRHRDGFRAQVRLAASMRYAVVPGMTAEARRRGMTAYNLFVHLNQQAFNGIEVDYTRLVVATGTTAPVGFISWGVDTEGRFEAHFEKNPTRARADRYDHVLLYFYDTATGRSWLAAPEFRCRGEVATVLPDEVRGATVHVWGFVTDAHGDASDSQYLGCLADAAVVDDEDALQDEADDSVALTSAPDNTEPQDNMFFTPMPIESTNGS